MPRLLFVSSGSMPMAARSLTSHPMRVRDRYGDTVAKKGKPVKANFVIFLTRFKHSRKKRTEREKQELAMEKFFIKIAA